VTALSETAQQALAIINWRGGNANEKQKHYRWNKSQSAAVPSAAQQVLVVTAKAIKRKQQSTGDSGDSNNMQRKYD